MSVYRPGGVISLAAILIIVAALEIIEGIALIAIIIPQSYAQILSYNLEFITSPYPPGGDLFGAAGFLIAVSQLEDSINFNWIFGWNALIFAGVIIFASIGLLKMKSWGRYVGLILGILVIIWGSSTLIMAFLGLGLGILSFIFGIFSLPFGIYVIVYLMGEVKYDFQ